MKCVYSALSDCLFITKTNLNERASFQSPPDANAASRSMLMSISAVTSAQMPIVRRWYSTQRATWLTRKRWSHAEQWKHEILREWWEFYNEAHAILESLLMCWQVLLRKMDVCYLYQFGKNEFSCDILRFCETITDPLAYLLCLLSWHITVTS